jgi:hypothetical protein
MEWISRNEIFRMPPTKIESQRRLGIPIGETSAADSFAPCQDAEITELREQLKVIRELKESRFSMLTFTEFASYTAQIISEKSREDTSRV